MSGINCLVLNVWLELKKVGGVETKKCDSL